MAETEKPRTARATELNIRRGQNRQADKLRAAGWVAIPPEAAGSLPPEIYRLFGPTHVQLAGGDA